MDQHLNQGDEPNNKAVYLESLGAAQTVTGSKHLLLTPEFNLLVDCGLFQGLKALRLKNWEPFPVKAGSVNAMILTHAHLDHCGAIPLLVKSGYQGPIYMSSPTRDLAELILRDSAKLQEEDAWKANKYGYSKHHPALPLYDTADVEASLHLFKTIELNDTFRLNDHLWFRFYMAGHIQGACSIEVNCYGKTIVFSGDIGRYQSELLPAPHHPAKADFVMMESTYGNRLHEREDTAAALAQIINDAVSAGGNLLVPCFAVGRAQEVIHLIYRLKQRNAIPQSIPVYLDSPMASLADKTMIKYPEWLTVSKEECAKMFSDVTINQDYNGTQEIIGQRRSKIVLAASGMLTGGRVLEYLKHYVTDPKNTILVVGYQGAGTRGRALLSGTHELKMHGQYFEVNAKVKEIGGLSAHADQSELLRWLKDFSEMPERIYLVHGEPPAQEAFLIKVRDEFGKTAKILRPERREFLFSVS